MRPLLQQRPGVNVNRDFPEVTMSAMRSAHLLLLLAADAAALLLPATASRVRPPTMGLFDELGKMMGNAFSNEDYSQSAAQYEQTNARASHILVGNEDTALDIKAKLASGELLFDEAAMKFSTCNSASSGGKLGPRRHDGGGV